MKCAKCLASLSKLIYIFRVFTVETMAQGQGRIQMSKQLSGMASTAGRKMPIFAAIFIMALAADAAVITYNGFDAGASGPGANAMAARANFLAAVGSPDAITFEGLPLGSASNLMISPGVTLTTIAGNIRNSTGCSLPLCGGNTTVAGSQFLELSTISATVIFNFSTPIDSFGAYFGGLQVANTTITFNDGSPQSVTILPVAANGGFAFVGFTDFGSSISSITINALNDIVSVDDVLTRPAGIPEPSSFGLIAFGLAAVAAVRRRVSR
jgi:hypothetical protein